MFAAAMMFACPNLELSIYSTCKRISQTLLRNIVKFLELIYLELNVPKYKVLRMNSEEVHVEGNEGHGDVRVINSYPSKIGEPRVASPQSLSSSERGLNTSSGGVGASRAEQSLMMIGSPLQKPLIDAVFTVCSMQPSGEAPHTHSLLMGAVAVGLSSFRSWLGVSAPAFEFDT
jgi:hypothetical protein